MRNSGSWLFYRFASLVLVLSLAISSTVASADEADAKAILKKMSDYLAAQSALSFDFDAYLGVVTDDGQSLELTSSGSLLLQRPDKFKATRAGGFVHLETIFDGKTFTVFGKDANVYTQIEVPGTLDNLMNHLIAKYDMPMLGGDFLMSNPYQMLMADVVDIKDLGSGVINGVECDYLAFRAKQVDWQIWIAQGEAPYPCRYVITSTQISGEPQYSIQLRNWSAGKTVAKGDFSFKNTSKAEKVELKKLQSMELPGHFEAGEE